MRCELSSGCGSLDSQQRQDAVLMVSELVTNALLHGVGAISLRIDVEADMVQIEVADEGNVALAPRPEPRAHGGWLQLGHAQHVSDLASRTPGSRAIQTSARAWLVRKLHSTITQI